MEEKQMEQKRESWWENGYFLLLTVYLLESFFKTTMFPISWPAHSHDVLQCALAAYVVLKFACGRTPLKGKAAWFTGLGCLVFFLSSAISEYWVVRDVLFLALGASGISFRKLLTVYLAVLGPALVLTVAAALTGQIENLVYVSESRRSRIAFGVNYPTDFAAYLFFGALVYGCWRRTALRWWEIAGIEGLALFSWYFCDARNNAGCLALLGLGAAVLKLWAAGTGRKEEGYYLPKGFQWLLISAPAVFPAAIWGLTAVYDSGTPWMVKLDALLSNRLALGKKGMDLFGVTWFGQQISMVGNGGSTAPNPDYFFLDSSYVLMGMRFGMALLLFVCGLFVLFQLRLYRRRKIFPMLLLAALFVECTLEHHFFEYVYNPFLILALSHWDGGLTDGENDRKRGSTGG